jgi:Domain of unknown function (DUF4386)
VNVERAAGAFSILLPLAFNAFFLLLGRRFDYPDILRRPTEEILSRFQAGGVTLKLLWYGFMLTAVLLIPVAVLLGEVFARDGLEIVPVATTIGVLAGVVQFLGLARWPFLVPELARAHADPASSQATREATRVAFESFHRYLGIGIGECLGYLFTGAWTMLVGVAMLQSSTFDRMARMAGNHHRPVAHHRVSGVRRPLRRGRLEARRRDCPDRLHRLVAVANPRGAGAPIRVATCPNSAALPQALRPSSF